MQIPGLVYQQLVGSSKRKRKWRAKHSALKFPNKNLLSPTPPPHLDPHNNHLVVRAQLLTRTTSNWPPLISNDVRGCNFWHAQLKHLRTCFKHQCKFMVKWCFQRNIYKIVWHSTFLCGKSLVISIHSQTGFCFVRGTWLGLFWRTPCAFWFSGQGHAKHTRRPSVCQLPWGYMAYMFDNVMILGK